MADDPDAESRTELESLLAAGDEAALADRFQGPLTFGTAGLRGLLGAGPHRMNPAVVIRATAGLCAHLLATVEGAAERGICIGFDGRRRSAELAAEAAAVVAGAGMKARIFENVAPTPLVGFSVLDQNAAGGIVITASHNPPDYNGYKVYWENGAQIVPPHDAGIAAAIEAIPSVLGIPRKTREQAPERYEVLPADVAERYLAGVKAAALHPEAPRDIKIAYTAMHGVGEELTTTALRQAGFDAIFSVPEQAKPDGTFPTVAFPNPEEDGAMDMVLALAEKHGADLVLANDPDADRLAVSVLHKGNYESLSGNDIGCLLAHYLLQEGPQEGKRAVVESVVSSPMLLAIGEFHGARAEMTLTGHKWIQNRGIELEAEGHRFVFGYEEALGYAVGSLVRDKDGISAAAVMADMAAYCKTQGRTLIDERELAWRRYGMFLSEQVSLVFPGAGGAETIAGLMTQARSTTWESIGGLRVLARQDFLSGKRVAADGTESDVAFPSSNVLVYELEGGHRAMLRPSGTEPKLKTYFDVRVDVAEGESIADAKARGGAILEAVTGELKARLQ